MKIYLKPHYITGIFQRVVPQVQNSDIEKYIYGYFWRQLFLVTFRYGGFSK